MYSIIKIFCADTIFLMLYPDHKIVVEITIDKLDDKGRVLGLNDISKDLIYAKACYIYGRETAETIAKNIFDIIISFLKKQGFLQAKVKVEFWKNKFEAGSFQDNLEYYV